MKTKLLSIAAGLLIGSGAAAQITPTPQVTERNGWAVIDSSTAVQALKLTKYTEGMNLQVDNWQGNIYEGTAWDATGTELTMKYDGSKLTNVISPLTNWTSIFINFQAWEERYAMHIPGNPQNKYYSYYDSPQTTQRFAANPSIMRGVAVDFSNPKNAYITFEYKLEASQPKVPIVVQLVDALDRRTNPLQGELVTTNEWETATIALDPQAVDFDLAPTKPAGIDANGKLLLYANVAASLMFGAHISDYNGNYELAVERICGMSFDIFPEKTGLTETATLTIKNFQMGAGNYDFVTLTKSGTGNGTVTGNGNYERGETVTVTATAHSNSEFMGWEENGKIVSTNKSFSFAINGDKTLKAVFQLLPHITVQANPLEMGNITGNSGYYKRGATATFTAEAKLDSKFIAWQENGVTVSTNATYTFEVSGDRTLIAVFEATNPKVTVSAANAGAGIVRGGGTYLVGELAEAVALAYLGYEFDNWQEDGLVVSYNARYLFSVTQSRNLVAIFKKIDISDMEVSDGIAIIAGEESAQVAWCAIESATGYTLVIKGTNNELVCRLEFDAMGRLLSLDFGSGLKSQENLFGVRVTNLSENTTYSYTMEIFGEGNVLLETKAGTFTTKDTGTAAQTTENQNLVVYPNPTKGQISINSEQLTTNNVVRVYNSIGVVVGTFVCTPQNNIIDISNVPNGVYFVQVNGKKVKVVKQ